MRRKLTESFRATVVQELRAIVGPELNVEPGTCRHVTVMTPASPQVAIAITPYVLTNPATGESTVLNTPRDFGLNQTYKAVPVPTGSTIHFEILAEQSLIAASEDGLALLGLIVEYVEEFRMARRKPSQKSVEKSLARHDRSIALLEQLQGAPCVSDADVDALSDVLHAMEIMRDMIEASGD